MMLWIVKMVACVSSRVNLWCWKFGHKRGLRDPHVCAFCGNRACQCEAPKDI